MRVPSQECPHLLPSLLFTRTLSTSVGRHPTHHLGLSDPAIRPDLFSHQSASNPTFPHIISCYKFPAMCLSHPQGGAPSEAGAGPESSLSTVPGVNQRLPSEPPHMPRGPEPPSHCTLVDALGCPGDRSTHTCRVPLVYRALLNDCFTCI